MIIDAAVLERVKLSKTAEPAGRQRLGQHARFDKSFVTGQNAPRYRRVPRRVEPNRANRTPKYFCTSRRKEGRTDGRWW